jgi:hypothetical protein
MNLFQRRFEVIVRRVALFIGSFVVLAALAACGGGVGGSTAFNYGGNWSGTIQDSFAGAGTVSLTMTQSGNNLVGTWQATFNSGNNGGSLVGVVNGNEIALELHPSNPNYCPYNVVAQRSGSSLSGTYAAFNCLDVVTGSVSVTKQ